MAKSLPQTGRKGHEEGERFDCSVCLFGSTLLSPMREAASA